MEPLHRKALARALSRRSVLRGTGLAVAGVGLAACTGPDEENPRLPDPHAHTVVDKSAVPEGSGVIVEPFVVTQPEPGVFKAYSSVCPHQGCHVTSISEQTVICGCHGSQFSTTDGSVSQGPATQPLAEAKVIDSGDQLQITAS